MSSASSLKSSTPQGSVLDVNGLHPPLESYLTTLLHPQAFGHFAFFPFPKRLKKEKKKKKRAREPVGRIQ